MLGKVLWKMHKHGDSVLGNIKRIGYQVVIDAFVRAIKSCPDKRDSRHPDKDPILEPHYKLASVVHKLRLSSRISVRESALCCVNLANKRVGRGRLPNFEGYAILTENPGCPGCRGLDKLYTASHQSPQIRRQGKLAPSHGSQSRPRFSNVTRERLTRFKAAHIIYNNNSNEAQAAVDAKHEITQQIFTKTMAIQVWKPDNERAGRHFVYTSRYVRFLIRLLYQLSDRSSLEALARRIRKKATDLFGHVSIWQEVCHAYLKVHSSTAFNDVNVLRTPAPAHSAILQSTRPLPGRCIHRHESGNVSAQCLSS